MHEPSLIAALLEQIEHHLPDGAVLSRVTVRAGALQAIEPELMRWAWRAATMGTAYDGAELNLIVEPYRLHCPQCDRQWNSEELFQTCNCGCEHPHPVEGHELLLESLDIHESDQTQPADSPQPLLCTGDLP